MYEKRRKEKKGFKEGKEEKKTNINAIKKKFLREKERVKENGRDVALSDFVSRRQILDVLE